MTSSGRELKAITGFAEYQEAEHIRMDEWLGALREVFSKNGFSPRR